MSYTGKERTELIKHRLTYTMNMIKKLGITVYRIYIKIKNINKFYLKQIRKMI